jgi:hypothetical protein
MREVARFAPNRAAFNSNSKLRCPETVLSTGRSIFKARIRALSASGRILG